MAEEFDYSGHVGQTIHDIRIEDEIKTAYIDYAMSVIVSRALPDVRDGLKPVHRRVLYAMDEDHLTYDKAFRKSATTVGDVLGRYHPHGDTAVYDTMVRLAQPFSLRYPLIEGHGNFGNIDGDPPAAYRYTEAKMSKIANEMLADIDKNVVDFDPNFDNTRKEPRVLPARFPNLLVNGSVGIAVGMATNVPPHNLTEVCKATEYLIDNPECAIPELMQFIQCVRDAVVSLVERVVSGAGADIEPRIFHGLQADRVRGRGAVIVVGTPVRTCGIGDLDLADHDVAASENVPGLVKIRFNARNVQDQISD